MRFVLQVAATGVIAAPAFAANLDLTVEIPKLNVAEYHRPYVAIWVERPGEGVVSTLSVWYDVKKKDQEGEKWLKDMRQWWRRIGRELDMPADGVSGATRVPGKHQVSFADGKAPLPALTPGKYELVVEASRETGGRELLRVPFEWPVKAPTHLAAQGENELGAIALDIKP